MTAITYQTPPLDENYLKELTKMTVINLMKKKRVYLVLLKMTFQKRQKKKTKIAK